MQGALCTASSSTALTDASAVTVVNSIIWNNRNTDAVDPLESEIRDDATGTIAITYSCINQAPFNTDATNIATDPLFAAAPAQSFYLQPTSPCVDTGNPAASDTIKAVLLDRISILNGAIKVQDITSDAGGYQGIVDMGYHYEPGQVGGP